MSRRAVLAAAVLAWFSSVAGAQPSAVVRGADSHTTVQTLQAMLQALPESTVRTRVLPLLENLDQGAAQLPATQREEFLAQNLAELTAAAFNLTPDAAPRDVLRQLQNSAAYMNNRANRWEEAARLSDQVLSYAPQDRDALLNRSNAGYGLKNFKSAFLDADQAVRIDGDDPDGYTARALAAWGLGDYLQTMEDARRALAMNPNDRTAHALMRLAEGRVPPAAIHDARARLEVEVQREYHGMVTQLNQVEAKSQQPMPEPASALVGRQLRAAAGKIALKDYYGAIASADQVLAADPGNAAAYYYRAAAYNLIGRYERAVADASQALSIDPGETEARDARSFAFNHLGRCNDALADANHSLEINPQNSYAFANRGFAHEKLGDLEAMLQDLKKAAELNAQFDPVYRDAAAAYGVDLPVPGSAQSAPPPPAGLAPHQKQFLFILLSSVAGGILIALGLLHVFGARWAGSAAPAAAGPALPKSARGARAGSAIGDSYAIGKPLGHGGMGVVYEAVDKTLGRKVAIKMLQDEFQLDARVREQFLDEARTVADLHHPNIVDIHAIVSDDRGLCLVFEFIAGSTVSELIARKGRLSLASAKVVMRPVCAALEFAHRRQVVHRDLKPDNIMVTEQGVIKVMDFGISRRLRDARQTAGGGRPGRDADVTDTVAGTPYYMAPEQEYGVVRPEADIFSLGACLYEMTTGRRPYPPPASHAQKLAADYPKPSVREPSLPRSFDVLVDAALHPDPDRRIHTAADFWAMLDAVRDRDTGLAPS